LLTTPCGIGAGWTVLRWSAAIFPRTIWRCLAGLALTARWCLWRKSSRTVAELERQLQDSKRMAAGPRVREARTREGGAGSAAAGSRSRRTRARTARVTASRPKPSRARLRVGLSSHAPATTRGLSGCARCSNFSQCTCPRRAVCSGHGAAPPARGRPAALAREQTSRAHGLRCRWAFVLLQYDGLPTPATPGLG